MAVVSGVGAGANVFILAFDGFWGNSQTGIRYPNMGVVIHRKWWYDYHPHNGDMTRKNHVEHRGTSIFLGLYGFRS